MKITNDFLDEIFEDCNFEEVCQDNFEFAVIENLHIPDNLLWTFGYGATKGVLIFDDFANVIKIPFLGELTEEEDEKGCVYDEFTPFANAPIVGDNYCEAETELWERAYFFNRDLSRIFLNNTPIEWHGYVFYLQEKCDVIAEDMRGHSQVQRTKARTFCHNNKHQCFDASWICDAIDYYGRGVVNALLTFIEREGITDLHRGNLGYIGNAPVILDYGGYNE